MFIDLEKGIETYLLKVQPGGEAPAHIHEHDEICMVLEGSLDFDETHLMAGDYHVARKGSTHGYSYCPAGALLYMQSALAEQSSFRYLLPLNRPTSHYSHCPDVRWLK